MDRSRNLESVVYFLGGSGETPLFKDVHRTGEGMYDKPFMEYVSNILNAKS